MIIGITGMPCAGKTTLCNVFESMGFEVHEMSSVIKQELKKQQLDLTNTNMRELATELRKKFGENIMATRLVKNMKKTKNKNIVISGVRSYDEVQYFLNKFSDFKYISLMASPYTRFKRSQNRKRCDDPKNFEEFLYREEKELSWGLAKAIVLADYFLISNDSTIKDFENKCRVFIKNLQAT